MEMAWYIPLLIFCARIGDVSFGTLKLFFIVRGKKSTAVLMAFIESTIWLVGTAGAFKYVTNLWAGFAYCAGFAAGTLSGMLLEKLLITRYQKINIYNPDPQINLTEILREKGYPVTLLEGSGREGSVEICSIITLRQEIPFLEKEIQKIAPNSFITITEIMKTSGGVMNQLFTKNFLPFNFK